MKALCRLLSVQRSAYYEWRDCPCKIITEDELALRRRMKELFSASRGSLGSRTMMENLRQEGFEVGRERVRRLMKRLELKVRQKRTREQAIADVREYVAVYYNSKRLHSTLGYTTPMDYEKNLNKVSGIA